MKGFPVRPCFVSILESVPQKYCINRVTVQDISWACYVFVKCFILYVVMMVFSNPPPPPPPPPQKKKIR